jgi:hypothetical protein
VLGGAGLVYLAVKASLLTYREGQVPTAVLLAAFGVFSILHIYAARCAAGAARRRPRRRPRWLWRQRLRPEGCA